MSATLEARLLAAHAAGDTQALIGLYEDAARAADAEGRPEAAGFYRTHAFVFALEIGDPRSASLRAALVAAGRETA